MLDKLKLRLEIDNNDEDTLLESIIESATFLFLSTRYPTTLYPVDEVTGDPIIQPRWNDWILRCAIEMYSRIGSESETVHDENGIRRAYETGNVSNSLLAEIAPVAGIAR